jgi:alpha-galactosidase
VSGLAHLRGGGVSLLLDARGDGLPRIAHWGAELRDDAVADASIPPVAKASVSVPMTVALLPERAGGHRGRPGLTGAPPFSPRFALAGLDESDGAVVVRARDAGLELHSELRLGPTGVLELRHTLRNAGEQPYSLEQLACVLPVPPVAREILDLSGHWCRERHPQRRVPGLGTWLRENRRGRTGFDANLLLVAGTPGFGFRSGEVWGVHLAWSGDAASWAERLPDGTAVLGAAELLGPGEVALEPGEEYVAPWLYAAWSVRGLDGLSAALHAWERARPSHPRSPRPVVLNTWEAVYFDHRLDRLTGLADSAAELGVERFVLDDGWFRHRRDDTAGLGDWYVDEDVWPDGLQPLIAHVRGLGMQFGLWVEPEMVNPDSDLFRAHPEWVLQPGSGRLPVAWRGQQVLDLGHDRAFAYILERLDALLSEYDIGYLKWDHNRDLIEAGHEGRPGVRRQTLAVYRLLDELRARHPGVEIESCSSGGARADLGILARTDRIWASDTNDALERQAIQRWTGLLLAPELVGAHVGPPRAHTTGRVHDLSFRVATALFGHFGIEWDVTSASHEERAGLAEAIAFYKRMRGLTAGGEVVRADHHDPAAYLHGVVAADRSEAVFAYVQLATSALEVPGAGRLDGLDPERAYRVEPVMLAGGPRFAHAQPPPWLAAGGITLSGRALAVAGLQLPALAPEQALLLHLSAA